jgi:hypothetical protein
VKKSFSGTLSRLSSGSWSRGSSNPGTPSPELEDDYALLPHTLPDSAVGSPGNQAGSIPVISDSGSNSRDPAGTQHSNSNSSAGLTPLLAAVSTASKGRIQATLHGAPKTPPSDSGAASAAAAEAAAAVAAAGARCEQLELEKGELMAQLSALEQTVQDAMAREAALQAQVGRLSAKAAKAEETKKALQELQAAAAQMAADQADLKVAVEAQVAMKQVCT